MEYDNDDNVVVARAYIIIIIHTRIIYNYCNYRFICLH